MKLGVILGTFLLGLALILTTTPANALYYFNVKVTNKTGDRITVYTVMWTAKGRDAEKCWSFQSIEADKSYKTICSHSTYVQKWKRSLGVQLDAPIYLA